MSQLLGQIFLSLAVLAGGLTFFAGTRKQIVQIVFMQSLLLALGVFLLSAEGAAFLLLAVYLAFDVALLYYLQSRVVNPPAHNPLLKKDKLFTIFTVAQILTAGFFAVWQIAVLVPDKIEFPDIIALLGAELGGASRAIFCISVLWLAASFIGSIMLVRARTGRDE